jgi:hypothetical protein
MAAPQRPSDEHLSSSVHQDINRRKKKLKNALLISAHEERASDEKKNRTRDKMSGNTDVEKGNFAVKAGLAQVRDSHRKELARFSSARARFFFWIFSLPPSASSPLLCDVSFCVLSQDSILFIFGSKAKDVALKVKEKRMQSDSVFALCSPLFLLFLLDRSLLVFCLFTHRIKRTNRRERARRHVTLVDRGKKKKN